MQILAADIGTGTQDILLFDSEREVENNYKLVMPSPSVTCAARIRAATARRQAVVLSGVTMGGGPSTWAAEAHLQAGLPLYATPDAARTFNDDLEIVKDMGVQVVSEPEARTLARRDDTTSIVMRDFDLAAIRAALAHFDAPCQPDILAIAVFDHGNAPPGYSDRQFRFDYLARLATLSPPSALIPHPSSWHLARLAFTRDAIPPSLTRFQAVARSVQDWAGQVVLMDTAPAAALGALADEHVRAASRLIVVNVGNFHTLAFRLGPAGVEGLFEHHTGELNRSKLEVYLHKLADGTLAHQEVLEDMGHGALMLELAPRAVELIAVTGPRRGLLRGSSLDPYFAAPFGDMMMTGCYGLVRACAYVLPEMAAQIENRLFTAAGD